MTGQLIVAIISAVVALLSAGIATLANWRSVSLKHQLDRVRDEEHKVESTAEVMSRYSKPLLWAAYELAARLYHICERDWLIEEVRDGTDRQKNYALTSTQFVFAQYFTWVEILRRRVQFLDQGDNARTHELQNLIELVEHVTSTERIPWPEFLTYRMELRGIADSMLQTGADGATECVGYATFAERLNAQNSQLALWLAPFKDGLIWLMAQTDQEHGRLAHIQRNLIELIKFLDPDHVRLPDRRLNRIPGDNMTVAN